VIPLATTDEDFAVHHLSTQSSILAKSVEPAERGRERLVGIPYFRTSQARNGVLEDQPLMCDIRQYSSTYRRKMISSAENMLDAVSDQLN